MLQEIQRQLSQTPTNNGARLPNNGSRRCYICEDQNHLAYQFKFRRQWKHGPPQAQRWWSDGENDGQHDNEIFG